MGATRPDFTYIPNQIRIRMLTPVIVTGAVFRARQIYHGHVAALKLQDIHHECPTNLYEWNFYPKIQGGKGMPVLYDKGIQDTWNFLAMELLGPSIDTLFRKSGRNVMDLRSVCCLGMQVVSRSGLCYVAVLTRASARSNVLSLCTPEAFFIATFSLGTVSLVNRLMTERSI